MPPKRGGRAGRAGRQTASRAAAAAATQPPAAAEQESASSDSQPVQVSPAPTTTSGPSRGGSSSARGASAPTRGRGIALGMKLKPKAVKRTEEERAALAAKEAKRVSDQVAEEARQRARSNRFRGRGFRGARGRGRGAMGRGGMTRPLGVPDGPFSLPPGSLSQGGSRGGGFGGGAGFGGGGGGGGSGSGASRIGVKSEANRFSYSDYPQELEGRLNTDMFGGFDSEFADDVKQESRHGALSVRQKKQVLPMGILRQEHKEPEVVVATTAELEAQEQALAEDSGSDIFVQDDRDEQAAVPEGDEMKEDNEVWAGAPQTRTVKIEGEDGEPEEVTDISELARRRQQLANKDKSESKSEPRSDAKSKAKPTKGKEAQAAKRKKPAIKEQEDIIAEERLQVMLSELGTQGVEKPQGEGNAEEEGQTPAEAPQPESKEGLIYLFQFPPVVPPLHTVRLEDKIPVKEEPTDDVVMLDEVAVRDPSTVDLTTGDDKVKKEDGVADASGTANANNIGQGGFLGMLNIRKSGKAELSWGGQIFEMSQGMDAQFLTTVVLLEEADRKPTMDGLSSHQAAGEAYGLGKIRGKFNLAPILGDEEEWEVDPEDLAIEV
ncbi:uncharacterized protein E0L32_011168 [Thyridium curvatum]|uniref:RNA polymerase III RPC4 n=1 Tax=Thyridium curvatum TaxID=1093900 RepID=A0A507ALE7_9PEZI|nr:uncharacterized protein E0L32_011168 [Thyridium curvatum]TPX06944.1 hypothetical protein E0L32_011168 [Thyridium curvatum]